ncbi:uncharacterized protein FOMMEDRAFT_153275 [Fomitiporia mediterranea MF3/22]|uniref:uncharacterized protein n=1 Tax=Fomitiporia mediterranea (strain MF3/22) TaxID=694068 RepID=UPI0004407558|nr:uncharacterized protein FOMMEDRAFT_153275 [Fomitiporia mediterranea MF3/22]EJD05929.1 hypothetical protein FOMMEDRAFT_153275 [Fomitiporia mediterranea MF3/22]
MSPPSLSASRLAPTMARAVLQRRRLPIRRLMSSAPPRRPFKIHVGASFEGKPPEYRATPGRPLKVATDFPIGSDIRAWRDAMLSRPKGVPSKDAGEDFFYVQEVCYGSRSTRLNANSKYDDSEQMRNQSGISFGVADGVGGWIDVGVDPSLFSQALMYHAHRYCKQSWAGEPETDPLSNYEEREQVQGWELKPRECLELAHGAVLREKTVEAGSSTACLINVNASNGLLRAANLGDSGFCIFRSSNLLYYQPPQTHFFNCPKQLSKVPSGTRKYGQAYTDSPREADVYETRLRDGDTVVAYTDGLSDNVFANEMLQICTLISRSGAPEHQQAQEMADRLVLYARACMVNDRRISPFEIAAARVGELYKGGKVDE